MKRGTSPNSFTYEYKKNSNNNCNENKTTEIEKDIFYQLKFQVFEKTQKKGNYSNLLDQYKKLQDELAKISEIKKQLEIKLKEFEKDQRKKDIIELKHKNENLCNDLNEKIALNKKLYKENNAYFQELESKSEENQCLQEQIYEQEDFLKKFSCEKAEIEKNVYNLSKIVKNQEKKMLDLTKEINDLSSKNDGKVNLIKNRNEQNINIINNISDEKRIHNNLIFELKNKENNAVACQKKLNSVNETLNGLQNNINNLTNLIIKNKNDISVADNNLTKESSDLNILLSNNTHINGLIEDKNNQIESLNNDNDIMKKKNTEINCDNQKYKNLIELYKKHLILLVSQNKKLAGEIRNLLTRDAELKDILERDKHLQYIRNENKNYFNTSEDKKKLVLDSGIVRPVEEKNKNIKKASVIEKIGKIENNIKSEEPKETELNISQEKNEEQDMGEEELVNIDDNKQ